MIPNSPMLSHCSVSKFFTVTGGNLVETNSSNACNNVDSVISIKHLLRIY